MEPMNFKKTIISFSAVVLVIVSVISQATAVSAYNGEIPSTNYTYWESNGFTAVLSKDAFQTEKGP